MTDMGSCACLAMDDALSAWLPNPILTSENGRVPKPRGKSVMNELYDHLLKASRVSDERIISPTLSVFSSSEIRENRPSFDLILQLETVFHTKISVKDASDKKMEAARKMLVNRVNDAFHGEVNKLAREAKSLIKFGDGYGATVLLDRILDITGVPYEP